MEKKTADKILGVIADDCDTAQQAITALAGAMLWIWVEAGMGADTDDDLIEGIKTALEEIRAGRWNLGQTVH